MPVTSRRARSAKRRKRRMQGVVHDLTDTQWSALLGAWGACAYCGSPDDLQRDCNGEVGRWLRRKGLDEQAFLLRFSEIRARFADDVDYRRDPGAET